MVEQNGETREQTVCQIPNMIQENVEKHLLNFSVHVELYLMAIIHPGKFLPDSNIFGNVKQWSEMQ